MRISRLSVIVSAIFSSCALYAQTDRPAALIHQAIDESNLVTLANNTRSEATPANDLGPVDDSFALDHMLLQLKRSPEREAALGQFIASLHDSTSPNFHQWLTPEQFGASWGVAPEDVAIVSGWLRSHGFTVHGTESGGMVLDFSGNAGQVRDAFHTEIHRLNVKGVEHIANMSDPRIPAALEAVVSGIVSLHNFRPRALLVPKGNYTFTNAEGTFHALVPGDIAQIYNINPVFKSGLTGKGQSIMVVEDTYLYSTQDWSTFRNTFGLTKSYPNGSLSQISPAGAVTCKNPGFQGSPNDPGYGDDAEAIIDVEWASSGAPDAAIVLAACTDTTTTFGGLIAIENVINGPASKLPSVISVSYGEAEAQNGAVANAAYYFAYQQAVAEGVSVFVSSGDEGAASADDGSLATHGIGVSAFTSTPWNVSVGGTDFGYTADGVAAGTYWSSTNSSTYESALSYIQEIPWNDSCAGGLVANFLGTTPLGLCNNPVVTSPTGSLNFLLNAIGGSGGPSGCATGKPSVSGVVSGSCQGYPKPIWQYGMFGNPLDGVRDIPDVSLFASNGFWDAYYVTCWSNPDPNVGGGFTCNGAPGTWAGFGGTSVSSPIMAAIQALIDQKTGTRWGNPAPYYYLIADLEYGLFGNGAANCNSNTVNKKSNACVFYDITQGDNDGACKSGSPNCFSASGDANGVLSTSPKKDQPAYTAGPGWDFTTGIGTVNAANLVANWPF